ncbi:MAG: DUF4199 family protein [Bacteroidales bacterium]|nr:DUF4199 family protein [Bacteroidales bacterium]
MKETISSSAQWNNAGKAGAVLGLVVIVYSLITTLIAKTYTSLAVMTVLHFAGYVLWFAKLIGCFLLMKYFITRQARNYSGVTPGDSLRYGAKIAFFSALICAAYVLWSMSTIDQEGLTMLFKEAMANVPVDSNTQASIDGIINNAPVIFTVTQFLYCFIYGWIISAVIARMVPTEDL